MIYPDNFEQKIKFAKVRSLVKQSCLSPMGAELVDEMTFAVDFDEITNLLGETWEMTKVLQEEDDFVLSEFVCSAHEF